MHPSLSLEHVEVGRRLGHDLYRYRPELGKGSLPAWVGEGWSIAETRGLRRDHADRFVRKWLQLRLNAFRRGRVVDESVTPVFLREIDVPVCPVTRIDLTHGKRAPTDWSVDRLNNDGAYAPGNLAVMCTRANQAKADRTFPEVLRLACAQPGDEGLSPVEWLRLASLMLGPSHVGRASLAPIIPLAAPVAPWTIAPATQVIQYLFTTAALSMATRNDLVRQLRAVCGTEASRHKLARFADTILRDLRQVSPKWDVWLRPDVMAAFRAWRDTVDARGWAQAGAIAMKLSRSRCVGSRELDGWHLADRGYVQ